MKVLRFHKDQANFLELGDQAYFVYTDGEGSSMLIRAWCPHRGGPLFLGTRLSGPKESIRCPWHDSVVPVRAMQRKAPPMVVNRSECLVVIKDSVHENIRWVRSLLSDSETEVPCRAGCA